MTIGDRPQEVQGALAEVRKTKETALRLANGEYPESADHLRVLAGMIGQLAEQVERLMQAAFGIDREPQTADVQENRSPNETDAPTQEDLTPEDAPAEPLDDRSKQ